jgi:ubiquinone/menaquinone biosynthesis C-methylase UbiE
MGRDDRERRRLALQAKIINPATEHLLQRAGVTSGMRVLDLGCGIGEVSFLAARLVGPHGHVTAIDVDEHALASARQRAAQHGFDNITFIQGDLHTWSGDAPFDATVGRHILIHTPDPLKVVKAAFGVLRPGGVGIFQEYDFSGRHAAYPALPLYDEIMRIFREVFAKVAHVSMGMQLFHLAVEAGFCAPDCSAEYPVLGGAHSPFYQWVVESLRSILPSAESLGVARASELDIDTLASRLEQETVARNASFPAPAMIGCVARKS